jgi:hypothetical protein
MINEDKMIFYTTYLQGSAYDYFKPTLINYLKNNLEDQKEHIITTFNSYI